MTINSELQSEIIRLRFVEKWPIGSIASALQVHHSVVERLEKEDGGGAKIRAVPEKITDNFESFLVETITKYPKVKASRLFQMVKSRGYVGISKGHFRRTVKKLRPLKQKEAFLRLSVLRGEQGQVDWGDFGFVNVRGGVRRLYGFALTLSYCRAIYLKFFLSGKLADFEQGFEDAFAYFGGIPRKILLDNLKSGVTERIGKIIRYNSRFLSFADHYRFEPVACQPRRGNEKGKVERGIGYVRENFWEAREWRDIDDLNAQALDWCQTETMQRIWKPGDKRTVGDVYFEEKETLMPLPGTEYPAAERLTVSIPKTPYARFDTNDYSVPSEYVQRTIAISASTKLVSIYDGLTLVAEHPRSYDKHQTIENPEHIKALVAQKRDARRGAGQHRLLSAVHSAEAFLEAQALRGQNMGGCVTSLLRLLDLHGPKRLESALSEVVQSGSSQLRSVHMVLQRIEKDNPEKNPQALMELGDRFSNLEVKHHDLSRYDEIAHNGEDDDGSK